MLDFNTVGILLQRVVFVILAVSLVMTTIFSLNDYMRRRKITKYPFISFIMPTYNDGKYIEKTIKSIVKSYKKDGFEIIIINDKSKDNTLDILKKLSKKYDFTLINNMRNMGKAASVNSAFGKTKGEIIIVIDSDGIISKKALDDVVARFEEDPSIGGISCRYKVLNQKGFLPLMQELEYNMLSFMQSVYNPSSTIFLWGGLMAFRKKAFREIGMLSTHCLTEDMDAALKLNEHGWKVKQSYAPVYTQVPEKLGQLYRQKLRWGGGYMQGLISHYKVHLKNPMVIFFMTAYVFFLISFLFNLFNYYNIIELSYQIIKLPTTNIHSFINPLMPLWMFIFSQIKNISVYFIFTIPYVLFDEDDRKEIKKYLLLVPYSLIYFPVYIVFSSIGFGKAIYHYKDYASGKRAW